MTAGFTPKPAGTLYAQVAVGDSNLNGQLEIASTKWSTSSTDFSNPLPAATINNVSILTNLPRTGGVGIIAWALPIVIGVALCAGAGVAVYRGKGVGISR